MRKRGWQARLELGFAKGGPDGERTVLALRRHVGPLAVQRSFHPEPDGTCHVYILHPPGGVAGGDELVIDADVASGASALLTTPAAGKLYRTAGEDARLVQALRVASGARLEWLPQETIVFDRAQADVTTRVHLEDGAQFVGWEILCFGRPASGEQFTSGWCHTRWEVRQGERPLLLERGRYAGGDEILSAGWGLAGFPVCGTLMGTAQPDAVEAAREALQGWNGGRVGVTWLNGLLVACTLSHHADAAKEALTRVWHILRREQGRNTVLPRIWST
ncbi:MAG TPA: urease accessory protein UreD [bacterium]